MFSSHRALLNFWGLLGVAAVFISIPSSSLWQQQHDGSHSLSTHHLAVDRVGFRLSSGRALLGGCCAATTEDTVATADMHSREFPATAAPTTVLREAEAAAAAAAPASSPMSYPPNEYCCCTSRAVEENASPLLEVLDKIVDRPFFRIFRVNVKRDCSYWAVNTICSLSHNPCAVCRCDMQDVPVAFRQDGDMGVLPEDWNSSPIVRRHDLHLTDSVVRQTDGDGQYYHHEQFLSPLSWNDGGGHGVFSGFDDVQAEFFDLRRNPEGFTGYQGQRIWDAIYNENCFKSTEGLHLDDDHRRGTSSESSSKKDQCAEQQVFYQLLSGLHTSISVHLSMVQPDPNNPGTFRSNCSELRRRVTSHPGYVRNLHTVYLFVVRAVSRAAALFLDEPQYLGDAQLISLLQMLFQEKLMCSNTFNETKFLESPLAQSLVSEMKRMVHNITTLMDCVACEKCRMWGKLQTIGLATALKIVVQPRDVSVVLTRGEKVSIINLLRQLSLSVHHVSHSCQEAGEK